MQSVLRYLAIAFILIIFCCDPVLAQGPVAPAQSCPTLDQETVVSLRDYFERLNEEQNRVFDIQFENSHLAVETAMTALEGRLDLLNEFRATLESQNATYATREIVDTLIEQTRSDIADLRGSINKLEIAQSNQAGQFTAYAAGLAIVFSLINIGMRFIK